MTTLSRSKYLMRQFGLLSEQMSNPPFETDSSVKTHTLGYNLTLYEYYNHYMTQTNENTIMQKDEEKESDSDSNDRRKRKDI